MSGFDNEVMFAKNWDFREVEPVVGQATSGGDLPIGTGGSPEIKVGQIVSADNTVTVSYSDPNIDLSAGGTVATTYQSDSGSATPVGNVLNVDGIQETSTRASGNTVSVFSPRLNTIVVDPTTDNGTHTTLASGLAAASSGDIVIARPASYTENITMPAGVTLVGLSGYGGTSPVKLTGKVSIASGVACIQGFNINTNSDYGIETTGTGSLEVRECSVYGLDNDVIHHTSSGSTTLRNCQLNLATTGIKLFDVTAGTLSFRFTNGSNSGASTTQSTCSGGMVDIQSCGFPYPMVTSGSGYIAIYTSKCDSSAINTTILTTAGTGNSGIVNSMINSGTASDISIGAGTTVQLNNVELNSSNANAITGAGTVKYASFTSSTSTAINPTSTTGQYLFSQGITFNSGGNYLGNYETGTWTPELTGASGAPTITYTSQVGRYTRIGDMVFASAVIIINTFSGGSGAARCTGLPFTVLNSTSPNVGTVQMNGVNFSATAAYLTSRADSNTTYVRFYETNANATGTVVDITDFAAGDSIALTVSYRV